MSDNFALKNQGMIMELSKKTIPYDTFQTASLLLSLKYKKDVKNYISSVWVDCPYCRNYSLTFIMRKRRAMIKGNSCNGFFSRIKSGKTMKIYRSSGNFNNLKTHIGSCKIEFLKFLKTKNIHDMERLYYLALLRK